MEELNKKDNVEQTTTLDEWDTVLNFYHFDILFKKERHIQAFPLVPTHSPTQVLMLKLTGEWNFHL